MVDLVLVASLSALYAVFRAIPTFPMFAIPGASFRAGDIVAPLYGIILGPLVGPLAVAFGTIIGFFVGAPPVFLGLDFLPATMCATVVGLATRRRRREAILLNIGLILAFLSLPFAPLFIQVGPYQAGPNQIGPFQIPYVWLHLGGLAVLASPVASRAIHALSDDWTAQIESSSRNYRGQFLAILVLAFIGTLAQHVTGGIITQAVVGLNFNLVPGAGRFETWQAFWTFVFWIYPGERTIIALAATAIAAPVVIVLKFSRLTQHLPRMKKP